MKICRERESLQSIKPDRPHGGLYFLRFRPLFTGATGEILTGTTGATISLLPLFETAFISNWHMALSRPPTVYSHFPSLLNFTFITNSECPLYSLNFDFSFGQGFLNIFTLLKSSPVASSVPSGDRSTALTCEKWDVLIDFNILFR
jgi:hypothetical protein